LGGDFFDRLEPQRLTRYYVKRLESLGHKVITEVQHKPTDLLVDSNNVQKGYRSMEVNVEIRVEPRSGMASGVKFSKLAPARTVGRLHACSREIKIFA
jgi:hypothetical protein